MRTRAIALLPAFVLAACGGGGLPSGSVVNSPGGPTQSPPPLVKVRVTVTVPASGKSHEVRPDYVSVNTHSLVIQLASVNGQGVSGVNPTTIDTVAHAPGCKPGNGGLVCTATAFGSPGEDVFAVTTYAGTNSTGPVLSVGTVQAKISGGAGVQISNRLSLSLDSVIAGLKVAISPNEGRRGKPMRAGVTLIEYDASGAQIVGPSDFVAPVNLAIQGDAHNSFLLHINGKSATSFSIVKPTSNITLSYDGNTQASSITIGAGVDGPGSHAASANFKLRGKQPPPPVGTIYALNLGTNNGVSAMVTEYDGKAKGNATPKRVLQLSTKLYARSIAVDSSGNLYVGYFDNEFGFSPSNGRPDKGNEIAIYPPGASGNQQPSAIITADTKSSDTTIFPLYMALDPAGDLVTYGATSVDGNNGNDAAIAYSPGSSQAATPVYAWAFVSPLLTYSGPTGLALDSAGNFYVNGALHTSLGPSYGLFVAPASDKNNPTVTPSRAIPWNATSQLAPGLVTNNAIDDSGEPYVATKTTQGSGSKTSCQGSANVFGTSPSDVQPLRVLTFSGVFTQNATCSSQRNPLVPYFPSITIYGSLLFVADDFNNAIDAYQAGGNGLVKPTLQIAGSATQLNAPISLVITKVSGRTPIRPAHPPDP
jgi:hypothetical protein